MLALVTEKKCQSLSLSFPPYARTLKKTWKMDELESASRMMERKVLTQPLSTAGPMWVTASWARLLRLPEKEGGGDCSAVGGWVAPS